ncbi:MAG: OB-fold nucleic acid binding domain-containing protein [archaeon]
MRDSTLVRLSLAWALIGIFVLLGIAAFAKPEQVHISELENNLGKTVAVSANVAGASYKQDVSFFTLEDETGTISAVFFGNMTGISEDDVIAVKGKVSVYKGELELVANEIVCLKCGT